MLEPSLKAIHFDGSVISFHSSLGRSMERTPSAEVNVSADTGNASETIAAAIMPANNAFFIYLHP